MKSYFLKTLFASAMLVSNAVTYAEDIVYEGNKTLDSETIVKDSTDTVRINFQQNGSDNLYPSVSNSSITAGVIQITGNWNCQKDETPSEKKGNHTIVKNSTIESLDHVYQNDFNYQGVYIHMAELTECSITVGATATADSAPISIYGNYDGKWEFRNYDSGLHLIEINSANVSLTSLEGTGTTKSVTLFYTVGNTGADAYMAEHNKLAVAGDIILEKGSYIYGYNADVMANVSAANISTEGGIGVKLTNLKTTNNITLKDSTVQSSTITAGRILELLNTSVQLAGASEANTLSLDATSSLSLASGATLTVTDVVLSDGATFVTSDNITVNGHIKAADTTSTAIVEIAEGYVLGASKLAGNGGNIKLTGSGTYKIEGNELSLGSGITVDSDADSSNGEWSGTVATSGDTSLSGSANLAEWKNTELNGSITVNTGATLTLGGNIKVKADEGSITGKVYYSETTDNSLGETNGNGYATNQSSYVAVKGELSGVTGSATWTLNGSSATYEGGTIYANGEKDLYTYWVNNKEEAVTLSGIQFAEETTTLAMNGGVLKLDKELKGTGISNEQGGEIEIGSGVELQQGTVTNATTNTKDIELTGDGKYYLGTDKTLADHISLGERWNGTVYTNIAEGTEGYDISGLGNAGSTVQLADAGDVRLDRLTAGKVGTVETPGALTLESGNSTVNDLEVKGELTLGTASGAAALYAGKLSTQGITLGNIASTINASELTGSTLSITIADSELLKMSEGSTGILTLGKEFEGTTTLNGQDEVIGSDGKMIYTLAWEEGTLARAAAAYVLNLMATTNPEYVGEKLSETVGSYSTNGRAGLRMLNNAYAEQNPQAGEGAEKSALAGLIDTVDAGGMTDSALAGTAGASTATLGMALSGDVERQLRAIRNRVAMGYYDNGTTLSLDGKSGLATTDSKKYFAWVNAEGNRAEQDADGTAAGYTLSSWGGTVGAGMQVNNNLTLGLALTAMYGDLESEGPDYLDGDMDTAYVSAFARYTTNKWNHALIGTIGSMAGDYKRTVIHATGSYSTYGDTEGMTCGLMYELSREYALSSKSSLSPVFNISYRHTEVDAYNETGSDAALAVGEQSLDTVTLGAGARYATTLGEQTLNRACAFQGRALAKYDLGDRRSETTTGYIGQATRAGIESAKAGAFGVELGAGVSVPVGKGSFFVDGAVELRSDYTNYNATVGYQIQF